MFGNSQAVSVVSLDIGIRFSTCLGSVDVVGPKSHPQIAVLSQVRVQVGKVPLCWVCFKPFSPLVLQWDGCQGGRELLPQTSPVLCNCILSLL